MSGFQKATRVSARDQRVQNYCDFLIGYQRGCIRGASDVFDLTLSVAYGIGYQDGFRVGYARGYADGYQAGYKDGQDVNWASVLHDVATIIDDAATVIAVFA
jgi:flagellar biosynthesis/type III secretory pathway protein FliH